MNSLHSWNFEVTAEVTSSKRLGVRPSLLRKIVALYGGMGEMEFTLTCDVYNDVVEPVICNTSNKGSRRWSSYCHYLHEQNDNCGDVGISSVYVSHTWRSTDFLSLVKAIEHYDERANKSGAVNLYYWIDVFSRDCSFDLPINVQEDIVKSCPRFIIAVSPVLRVPVAVTRLWCLLELHMAMFQFRDISVAMTKEDEGALLEEILEHGHEERYNILCDILRLSTASAFNENLPKGEILEKEVALRQCILQRSKDKSIEELEKLFQKQMLQSWISDTVARLASEMGFDKFSFPRQVACLEALGSIKKDLGLTEEALTLFEHCLTLHAKIYRGVNNVASGLVYVKLAMTSAGVNVDEAIYYFKEALGIFIQHRALQPKGLSHTATSDEILFALAHLSEGRGDLGQAMKYYQLYLDSIIDHQRLFDEQNERFLRELRWEQKHERRYHSWQKLTQTLIGQEMRGERIEAMDASLRMPKVFQRKWCAQRAHAHYALARVLFGEGNYAAVMNHLHDAHNLYTCALGTDSLFVAKVFDSYAVLYLRLGDIAEAISSFKESLFIKIRNEYGCEDTFPFVMLHTSPYFKKKSGVHEIVETLLGLGDACERCGKDEEALQAYEKALSIVEKNSKFETRLEKLIQRSRRVISTYTSSLSP